MAVLPLPSKSPGIRDHTRLVCPVWRSRIRRAPAAIGIAEEDRHGVPGPAGAVERDGGPAVTIEVPGYPITPGWFAQPGAVAFVEPQLPSGLRKRTGTVFQGPPGR